MVYALVLAGGSGTRMGLDKPKQFLEINNRPIIIRSIDAFTMSKMVDGVIVCVPKSYIEYTENLIKEFCDKNIPIDVISGGGCRNETLLNALEFLKDKGKLDENAVLLTHDSVRPFINNRIIKDNIYAAMKYGGCDTVVPCVDTVVESEDGEFISFVPQRNKLFNGQTPQSFMALKLYEVYKKMSKNQMEEMTDACSVFLKYGKKVKLVQGDVNNIKITYKTDIERAEQIVRESEND